MKPQTKSAAAIRQLRQEAQKSLRWRGHFLARHLPGMDSLLSQRGAAMGLLTLRAPAGESGRRT